MRRLPGKAPKTPWIGLNGEESRQLGTSELWNRML